MIYASGRLVKTLVRRRPAREAGAEHVGTTAEFGIHPRVCFLIPFEGGEEKELLEFVTRTGDTLIGRF